MTVVWNMNRRLTSFNFFSVHFELVANLQNVNLLLLLLRLFVYFFAKTLELRG